jgi:ATP-dependent Lon protease
VDITNGINTFELPDYGIKSSQTIIPPQAWRKFKDILLQTTEAFWGIVDLSIDIVEEGKKQTRKIALVEFKSFQPFTVDLAYFQRARKNFTINEWIDILLGALDFNSDGFDNEQQKLTILHRLIPFVEEKVNLIELAPKGTAKSYVYAKISKKSWAVTGGSMTRAKMFYDMQKKQYGLAAFYDVIAFDEINSMTFDTDIKAALKSYLEFGTFSVGFTQGHGTAGLVLLGNIPESKMHVENNMFESLPIIFKDSALIDRFHGFIEGWKGKRMEEKMKMNDWALSSEYYAEIMHSMRKESCYSAAVNDILDVPDSADTRDTTAVKRITTALVKILFPDWTVSQIVNKELFERYCLIPAINMRTIIKNQMGLIDTEYKGKRMPEITIKK